MLHFRTYPPTAGFPVLPKKETKWPKFNEKLTAAARKDFLNMVKDYGLVISALCGDLGHGFGNAEITGFKEGTMFAPMIAYEEETV